MRVQLFIPCFIDQLFPQVGVDMVQVLRRLGVEISYNPAQTCCGQPAFNAGFWQESATIAQKWVKDMSADELIIAPSASCVGFARNQLPKLIGEENTDYQKSAEQVAARLWEFSEFIVERLKRVDLGAKLKGKAVYHDSCAALRECGIKAAPRKLLQAVKGLNLLEAADCEVCCGFGGSFAVKFEPISVAMAEQKVETALALGADYIISTDMSCLMHLDGYIQQRQYPLKVLHIANVLNS